MDIKEIVRLPDPRQQVHIDVDEIVREVRGRAHVATRVKIAGWHFPHRAPEAFLVVGDVVSDRVVIEPDGSVAAA